MKKFGGGKERDNIFRHLRCNILNRSQSDEICLSVHSKLYSSFTFREFTPIESREQPSATAKEDDFCKFGQRRRLGLDDPFDLGVALLVFQEVEHDRVADVQTHVRSPRTVLDVQERVFPRVPSLGLRATFPYA